MSKAIGMIEFKTTSTGVTAADAMVKTSEVEIVEAQTVCAANFCNYNQKCSAVKDYCRQQ